MTRNAVSSLLTKAYDGFMHALAGIAGAMLVLIFASVIFDVAVRQSGGQPPEWAVPLSEYLLLYSTLLGAPWLVREGGHVNIDLLLTRFTPPARAYTDITVLLSCAVVCAVISVVATATATREYVLDSQDVRAVLVPKALLFFPIALGFGMCAIEFARLAFMRTVHRVAPD